MEKIKVVPRPNSVTYSEGTANPSAFRNVAEFTVTGNKFGKEGYSLRIEQDAIKVTANTKAGLFYAEQTLAQLEKHSQVPCCVIEDTPRFAYRGFMLDSARHMQSTEDIKKLIDAAASLKMNRFHWHLSDDQGFRIECLRFPELNKTGSWRSGDDFGSRHIKEPYGGFYTKKEIKEIVAYCQERFIEVIPEIDLPGHTTALISSYPELSCRKLPVAVKTSQGIFEDILCAGDSNTLNFVFELLEEIIPLFPSESFHIGGDEAPKTRWKSCPKCRAKIKELSLKNEEELQGWFTCRIIEFLKERGKKAIVWNESLTSGLLPADTVAQLWMDKQGNCVKWANRGSTIIHSDFYHYYCDYPYHMTPLKKTYEYSPIPKGVAPIMEKFVMGVEAPIWTEHIYSFGHLCYMAFPRFAAVAERGWTKERLCNLKDFEDRFTALTPSLNSLGIFPAPQKDWNHNPVGRLTGTLGFFADKLDKNLIINSAKNRTN